MKERHDKKVFIVGPGGLGKSFFTLSLLSILERDALILNEVINPAILCDPDSLMQREDYETLVSKIRRLIRPKHQRLSSLDSGGFDCSARPRPSYLKWQVSLSALSNPEWGIGQRSGELFIDNDAFGKIMVLDNLSSVSLQCSREFVDALNAIHELSQALAAKLNDKGNNNRIKLSGLALLILMVLLAILRFAGKPFGNRSKGRLLLSLGCSAVSNESTENKVRNNTRLSNLTYIIIRKFRSLGLNSRKLHLAVSQSGI